MRLPLSLQKAIDALLTQPGDTEPEFRRQILERNRSGSGPLPEPVQLLVEKIAQRPWSVDDQDFEKLRLAGYSEGQLYELTLAAALGAGLKRFEAGLHAIEEAS